MDLMTHFYAVSEKVAPPSPLLFNVDGEPVIRIETASPLQVNIESIGGMGDGGELGMQRRW